MALRAALARPKTSTIHGSRPAPAQSRLRVPAAFVALSLAVTGITATGTLLATTPAFAAGTPVTKIVSSPAGETWTVPAGVTSVTATVTGASGGSGGGGAGAAGGLGASIVGTFAVAPGDVLNISGSTKGGAGGGSAEPGLGGSGASAGGNGGAGYAYDRWNPAVPGKSAGGGGGGASKISKAGGASLIIAGGGGGGAGASAGLTPCAPGTGGAADAAGTSGRNCFAGVGGGTGGAAAGSATGAGLAGGNGGQGARISSGAGGGGAGLLGGSGGTAVIGAGGAGGGGGGGSSFVDAAAVTVVTRGQAATGGGSVTLVYTPSYTTTTTLSPATSSAVIGAPITLTVAVGAAGAPSTLPAGSVQLLDADDNELGAGALANGVASFGGIRLPIGSHTVRAVFTPSAGEYQESVGSAVITVAQGSTSTGLTVAPAPAEFGQSVTATIAVTAVAPANAVLDGTVELRTADGTLVEDASIDASGVATMDFTPSDLTPTGLETVQLTAFYLGNASFMASHSVESDLDVIKSESLLDLSQSIDTSVWGESVTLTADISAARDAVAPARMAVPVVGAVPTGTVTFYADGSPLATAGVTDGSAAIDVDDFEVGERELSASYSGDTYFTESDSDTLTHEVGLAATETTLAAISPAPLVGQPVTLSANVSVLPNGAGTPTGSVVFTVDGVALAATSVTDGVATLDRAFWSPGNHTVSADFSDGTHYAASSDAIDVNVEQAATVIALGSDVNPAVFGQDVTVSATLSVVAPGAGVPSGEIEFELDGAPFATVPVSAGAATLPLGALAVGSYEFSAHYAGDGSYAGTDASITITVEHAATALALSADKAETNFGESLTLHAALSVEAPGAGTPTGSIAFLADGVEIGSATLDASGAAASLTVPKALAVGARQITAQYAGDASFDASTSEVLGHAVLAAPVGIALDVSGESVAEQDAVFSATVQPITSTGHVPSGFVQFLVDGEPLGAPVPVGTTAPKGTAARAVVDVVNARLATDTLAVGEHVITVSYLGDGSFAAASSAATLHLVKPKAPIDPIKPIDPLTPVVPVTPPAPSAPAAKTAGGLASTGVQGIDTGIAAGLLLLAGLGMLGVGTVRLRRRSA
ncbi:Ig-like domain-containing protein [Microterricola viridarii]|uniref:Bacterial Ig-like domain-containing protein n=1 Tax=Microterricola viridarii TaxID=412690 RepID=A0A109QWI1_9MICO|nr:Ig-like domain-containing protein [Microterricola viridarii]AMB57724.1 hypothetical protein AWU67_01315 [Microterricola viridarii]